MHKDNDNFLVTVGDPRTSTERSTPIYGQHVFVRFSKCRFTRYCSTIVYKDSQFSSRFSALQNNNSTSDSYTREAADLSQAVLFTNHFVAV
jgi:hypothetical protein